ncbi:HmuY family protein [Maribacter polysiphoniae]|uniref:Heme-binding HmuY-like protein n=1 Tax=Maribacter polysiphoniae TaxID=429344 RepID=A0A316E1U2_9FLAO|nr:HmuY family protein [Maribacter polysiphoniae]MBD1260525.1 HmuY family protein [Maribacter polysiphoniae]PWK24351.1 heme-binding HmuY-like protein [Maribacter polysiphoniae]
MKTFKISILLAISILGLSSCSDDDDPVLLDVESSQVTNLHAEQTSDYTTSPPTVAGEFIKFDFSSGNTTESSTDWDIAFRGTSILVNGGEAMGLVSEPERTGEAAAYIVDDTFASVLSISEGSFVQDSAEEFAITSGSGNGWYTYDSTTHIITATAGKILVFRTADGHFAKVEILSYYYDGDTSNDSQYYTFNYVYQPNEGVTTF